MNTTDRFIFLLQTRDTGKEEAFQDIFNVYAHVRRISMYSAQPFYINEFYEMTLAFEDPDTVSFGLAENFIVKRVPLLDAR
jgi:hypothetical protein